MIVDTASISAHIIITIYKQKYKQTFEVYIIYNIFHTCMSYDYD